MSGRQPPHDPRRGAGRAQALHYGGRIAVAACVIALPALAGCSALNGSSAAASRPTPLTCAQQYQAWRTGPANAPGKKLEADAAALTKAADDIPVMTSDLKAVGTDATALGAYPMPACADPAGYWQQYLSAMKAAGDNAGSASGLSALILAEVPLKQVPAIQSRLTAELAKTAGVKAPAAVTQSAAAIPTLATVAPVTASALPTLATVAPATMPAPLPAPTLATLQPIPTTGS
jgi:hypothetical protein